MKINEAILPRKPFPKGLILLTDLFVCLCAFIIAYLLRFNFRIPKEEEAILQWGLLVMLGLRLLFFIWARSYSSIIRYISTRDALKLLLSLAAGTITVSVTNVILNQVFGQPYVVPFSVIIIEFLSSSFLLIGYRVLVKLVFLEVSNPSRSKSNVIIYGAGESGIITKRTLDRDAGTKYKVLAFIDDDTRKSGKQLEGVPIYSSSRLKSLLEEQAVAHLIISIAELPVERKAEVTETCLPYRTKVLVVPPVSRWINGELSFRQIRKINIEELLEREVIKINNDKVGKELAGKIILISGAAGSIGSEIVKQVSRFSPKQIICLDQAETPLYYLEQDLISSHVRNFTTIIGDILDEERMKLIFSTYLPQVVFHAAAYKHVPIMESNPEEAIKTNVIGTKQMADLSMAFGVEKFVMISTDKAVNPTSVMGASKRIAEMYIQAQNKAGQTRFITTRFGNVLGSNGSVIPLFRKQIEKGGPLTVTDPEVTRFFMTIPEACQLVLEAGVMGQGGEIFIFDMGRSVKIVDLARKMIQLSGLTLGRDIQIVFTGMRAGEKLYEELLTNEENTLPTYHKRIMIARVQAQSAEAITKSIDDLKAFCHGKDTKLLVRKMKEIVPEYISMNSDFMELDK